MYHCDVMIHQQIEELDLPYDREKNQRRGFCFIRFESEDTVDHLCSSPRHVISNVEVSQTVLGDQTLTHLTFEI